MEPVFGAEAEGTVETLGGPPVLVVLVVVLVDGICAEARVARQTSRKVILIVLFIIMIDFDLP